jgi:hypothetical protein
MTYGVFLYSKQEVDLMPAFEQFIREKIYLQNVSPYRAQNS